MPRPTIEFATSRATCNPRKGVRRFTATDAADDMRLSDLRYVVHLVADVHQPLDARYADDRGGNTYQLQAFGRCTNLHALWDTG